MVHDAGRAWGWGQGSEGGLLLLEGPWTLFGIAGLW